MNGDFSFVFFVQCFIAAYVIIVCIVQVRISRQKDLKASKSNGMVAMLAEMLVAKAQ